MRLSAVLLLVLVCLMIFTFHDVNGENHHKKGAGHKDMSPHRNHGPSAGGKDSIMPVKPPTRHHDGQKHKHSSKDRHRSPSAANKHHKNKHHDKKKHSKKPHGHKKDHRSSD